MFEISRFVVFVVSDGGDGDLEDEDQQSWVSPVIEQRLSELARRPDQFWHQLQHDQRSLQDIYTHWSSVEKFSVAEYKSCAPIWMRSLLNSVRSEELAEIWSSWRLVEYLYVK